MSENPDKYYRLTELEVKRLSQQPTANDNGEKVTFAVSENEPSESAPTLTELLDMSVEGDTDPFLADPIGYLGQLQKRYSTLPVSDVIGFVHTKIQMTKLMGGVLPERLVTLGNIDILDVDAYERIFRFLREAGFSKEQISTYVEQEIGNADQAAHQLEQRQLFGVLENVFQEQ